MYRYLCYTASSIGGATVLVHKVGPHRATVIGMTMFCTYVGCFVPATMLRLDNGQDDADDESSSPLLVNAIVYLGAILGGIGAGVAWTAQGVFFAESVPAAAVAAPTTTTATTTSSTAVMQSSWLSQHLASRFAMSILLQETILQVMSTVLLRQFGWHWSTLFVAYLFVAVASTVALACGVVPVVPPPKRATNTTTTSTTTTTAAASSPEDDIRNMPTTATTITATKGRHGSGGNNNHKLWAALVLLRDDPTMKYLVPFHISYSFAAAFLNSFVNGQVVAAVLSRRHNDENDNNGDSYVGLLTAFHGFMAVLAAAWFDGGTFRGGGSAPVAASSLLRCKVNILMVGSMCFAMIALPTLFWPDFATWHPLMLVYIYALEGIGRATSEGTLKALLADLYPHEKEGAFANIILQYGLASSLAYVMSNRLSCVVSSSKTSHYCVEYRDGTHHDLLVLSLVVVVAGSCSIASLWYCSGLLSPRGSSQPLRRLGVGPGPWRRRPSLEMLSIGNNATAVDENKNSGKYAAMVRNENAVST
jgi:MFS family permease